MGREVFIAGAVRTPIGKMGGVLSSVPAAELGAAVIREALCRSGVAAENVDEVLMGCVLQGGLGQNVARQCSMKAGIPESVPATTVNMVCGSSLKCVNLGAALIEAGQADIVVAGGAESMSKAPFVLESARFGYRMNDGKLVDSMVHDALWDAFNDYHMGITAENVAERYGISRAAQDAFAAESQQKCQRARERGAFDEEIVPIDVKAGKKSFTVTADEGPRDGVTAEGIAALRPAFKPDGTVTAANASGINDGAAAVVLISAEKAAELGIKPMARYIAGTCAGVAPEIMGIGAGAAAKKLLDKLGMTAEDMTLIEANEAFASQSIASARIAGWDGCMDRVNVNGGAIALGHPVGASGCRILVTLLYELRRRGGGKGLATLCIGGGMGVSAMVEI